MIEGNFIFIDSVAFIYLIENHPKYYHRVTDFITKELLNERLLVTSVISVSEFCVKPFRENDTNILADFKNVLEQLNIRVVEINYFIAEESSKLRAKYTFLKTSDAIQIASAITYNCKRFLTNDKQLKSISEIEIVLIEELF